MVFKLRRAGMTAVSAKTALCKSKRLTCFAHGTPTYPALQFRTGCNSDHVDWFLRLVWTLLSRFACEIGPICVCRVAPHVIRLCSMDFGIFASADGAGAGTPDKIQSALLFLQTLNPFQVSKGLIYARSAELSCTGWVDRAGCGPD